jgi:tetratricopeptide (TPR) repeat protein
MGKDNTSGQTFPANRREPGESWNVRIPDRIRQVIGRRLNHLSQGCNELLTIASAIGSEFQFDQLALLMEGVAEDQLVEAVEEALNARVIEELPEVVGYYQFTHALIQYTIADELSAVRKVRLHARIAKTLEKLYGPGSSEHAAELAYRFAQAATALGSKELVSYSLVAGERALIIYAYEEALGHFRRALAAREGQPMDAETAAAEFGMGRAQGAIGHFHEAWSSLGHAFGYYFESGDVARVITVAEYPLFYVPGINQTTRLVSQALTMVPPDSPEAGRLLCRYGLLLNLETADYRSAQAALGQALTIAHRERDITLEIQALDNAADVDFYHLR